MCMYVRACMSRRDSSLGRKGLDTAFHSAWKKKQDISLMHLFFRIGWRGCVWWLTGLSIQLNHPSGQPSIFPLYPCSFTHPAINPSLPLAKGPRLFVALIIWTNFLCNLFPSQPPTWSGSIRLLKVEPLIPASPLYHQSHPAFFLSSSRRFFSFAVSIQYWSNTTFSFFFTVKSDFSRRCLPLMS